MISSLRLRFFLVLSLVTIMAVAMVTLLANLGTTRDFNAYVANETAADQAQVVTLLDDVLSTDDEALAQEFTETAGVMVHREIYVVDDQGEVVFSSSPEFVGEHISVETQPILVAESILPGEIPAQIMFGPADPRFDPVPEAIFEGGNRVEVIEERVSINESTTTETVQFTASPEATFLGSLSRTFWLAALFAVGSTAALGLVLSQRVLQPVAALTYAARELEKGDLSRRVPITGRDEIGELAHAFNAMADGLEKQERLRRRLVSDVAHELRTPLTNIRGYLEGMQDGYVSAEPAVIQSLYEETLLLNRLVADLQDLSLAEAGNLRLDRQTHDMGELIGQAVTAGEGQAKAKGIAITVRVEDTLPAVLVDGERIGQILRNLLQNAIVHTPAGGQITMTAGRCAEGVQVAVRDSGPGIPPAHLPYLFERFYRGDDSRARDTGGTGLGLAIAREWVRLHGGQIWVESEPAQGATFSFIIPATNYSQRTIDWPAVPPGGA